MGAPRLKGGTQAHVAGAQQGALKDLVMVCAGDFKFSEAPNMHHRSLSSSGGLPFLLHIPLALETPHQVIENL